MTLYLVAGSQAATGRQNHVILVKMSQLIKTHKEDNHNDSNDSSKSLGICLVDNVLFIDITTTGSESDTADDEDEPVLDTVNVLHDGGVNRIRVCIFNKIVYSTYASSV